MFRVATVALQAWRATLANLKKKRKWRGCRRGFFVCLLSKLGFREPIGDALILGYSEA